MFRQLADPDKRRRLRDGHRKMWSDPTFRERHTKAVRLASAQISASLRKTLAAPEAHAKRLNQLEALRADPGVEARRLAALRTTSARARFSKAALRKNELMRAKQAELRGTFYLSPVSGAVIAMRSPLEVRYARCLDHLGRAWAYEPCAFELEDGVHYIPDFVVKLNDGDVLVEVKASRGPSHVAKVRAFQDKYPDRPLNIVGPREIRVLEADCAVPTSGWRLLVLHIPRYASADGVRVVDIVENHAEVQHTLSRAFARRTGKP